MSNGSATSISAANALASGLAESVTLTATLTGSIDLLGGNDTLNIGNFASDVTLANVEKVVGGTGNQTVTLTTALSAGSVILGDGTDTLNLGNIATTVTVRDVEVITGGTGDQVVAFGGAISGATVDLGAGNDKVNLRTFDITATLTGVETVSATTGNQAITFGGAITGGVISLGAGTDTLALGNFASTVAVSDVETITGGTGSQSVRLRTGATSIDLGAGADTLIIGTSMDLSAATLAGIEAMEVESGDTVTLTAAQIAGLVITGNGSVVVLGLTATSDLGDITVAGGISATMSVTGGVTFTGDFNGADVSLSGTGTLSGSFAALSGAGSLDCNGTASLAVSGLTATSDLTTLGATDVVGFTAALAISGATTFTGDFAGAEVALSGTGTLTATAAALATADGIDGNDTVSFVVTGVGATTDLRTLGLTNVVATTAVIATGGATVAFTGHFDGAEVQITGGGTLSGTYAVLDTAASIDAAGANVSLSDLPANADLGFVSGHTTLSATVTLTGDVAFSGDFNDAEVTLTGAGTFSATRSRLASAASIDAGNDADVFVNVTGINGSTDLTTVEIDNLVSGNLRATLGTGTGGAITVTTANYAGAALTVTGTGRVTGAAAQLATAVSIDGGDTASLTATGLTATTDLGFITDMVDLDATLATGSGVTFTGDFNGADVTLSGTNTLVGAFDVLATADVIDAATTAHIRVTGLVADSDMTDLNLIQTASLTAQIAVNDFVAFTGDFGGVDVIATGTEDLSMSVDVLATADSLDGSGTVRLFIVDVAADTDLTDVPLTNFSEILADLDTSGGVTFTGDFGGVDVALVGANTLTGDFAVLSTSTSINGITTATLNVTGLTATSDLGTLDTSDLAAFNATLASGSGLTFTGGFDGAAVTVLGSGTVTIDATRAAGADGIDGSGTASLVVTALGATTNLAALDLTNFTTLAATIAVENPLTFTGDFGGSQVTLTGDDTLSGSFAALATAASYDGGNAVALNVTTLAATDDLTELAATDLAGLTVTVTLGANLTYAGDFAGANVSVTGSQTLTGDFAVLDTADTIDTDGSTTLVVRALSAAADLTKFTDFAAATATIDSSDFATFTGDFNNMDVVVQGSSTISGSFAVLGTAATLNGSGTAGLRVTGLGATSDLTTLNITQFAGVTGVLSTTGGVTFTGDFDTADVVLTGAGTLTGSLNDLGTGASYDGGGTASVAVTGLVAASDLTLLGVEDVANFTASISATGNVTFTGDFDGADVTVLGSDTLTGSFADLGTAGSLAGGTTADLVVTGLTATSDIGALDLTAFATVAATLSVTGDVTFTGDFDGADVDLLGTGRLTGSFLTLVGALAIDGGTTAALTVTDLVATSDLNALNATNITDLDATIATGITFTGDFDGADVRLVGNDTLTGSFTVLGLADTIDGGGFASLRVTGLGATSDLSTLNVSALDNLTGVLSTTGGVTFTGDFIGADVVLTGSGTLTGDFDDLGTGGSYDGGGTASVAVTGLTATSDLTTLDPTALADFDATLSVTGGVTFTGDFAEADVLTTGTGILSGSFADLVTASGIDGATTASVVVTDLTATSDLATLGLTNIADLDVTLSVTGGVTFTGGLGGAEVDLIGTGRLTSSFAILAAADDIDGGTTAALTVTDLTATSDLTTLNATNLTDLDATISTTGGVTFTGDFASADVTLTGSGTLTGSLTTLNTADGIDGGGTAALLATGLVAASDLTTLNVSTLADFDATIDISSRLTFTGDFGGADVLLLGSNTMVGTFDDLVTGDSLAGGNTAGLVVTTLANNADLTTLGVSGMANFFTSISTGGGVTFTGNFAESDVVMSGGGSLTGTAAVLATGALIDGGATGTVNVTGLTATSDLDALNVSNVAGFNATISSTGDITFTGDFGESDVTISGTDDLTASFAVLLTSGSLDASGTAGVIVTGLTATSNLTALGFNNRANYDAVLDSTGGVTFTGQFDDADAILTGAGTVTASFVTLDTATSVNGSNTASLTITSLGAADDVTTLAISAVANLSAIIGTDGGITATGNFGEAGVILSGSGTLTASAAVLGTAASFASQTDGAASLVVSGLSAASDLSTFSVDRAGAGAVAAYTGTLAVGSNATVTGSFDNISLTLTGSATLTGGVDDLAVAQSIASSTGAGVTLTGLGQAQAETDYDHIALGSGVLTLAYSGSSTYAGDGVATVRGDLGSTDAIVITAGTVAIAADTLLAAATANGSNAIAVTGDVRVIIDADNEGDDLTFITQSGGTMTLVTTGEVVFQGDVGDATRLETATDSIASLAAATLIDSALTQVGGTGTVDTVLTFADNRASFAGITNAFTADEDFRALVVTNLAVNAAAFDLGEIGAIDVASGAHLTFRAGFATELTGSDVTTITGDGQVTVIANTSETVDLSGIDHALVGTFRLTGGSGANTLTGSGGIDLINGGGGTDVFRFTATAESPADAPDTIADFAVGSETLVFDQIAGGTFSFIAGAAFTGGSSVQARFDDGTDTLEVDFDTDGGADFAVVLTGVALADLAADNFNFISI